MAKTFVECCSYEYELSTWLTEYFCLPGISAQFLLLFHASVVFPPLPCQTACNSSSPHLRSTVVGHDAWTKCRILLFTKGWLVAFVTSTTSLESVATDSCTCAPTSLLGFELVDGHIWRPVHKRFWKVSRAIRCFLEPHRLVVTWDR